MKNTLIVFVLFISAVVCLSPSCKKKADEVSPISQLPPATQTGANTFGCLVNGQAFVPYTNSFLNSDRQCNYIYMNGGYYLTLSASNKVTSTLINAISIGTVNLPISEGQTFKLENYNVNGKAFGQYLIITNASQTDDTFQTTSIIGGQISISKLDQTNQIVSGTFSFDAVNSKGDITHVTEGRFDMKYTK